MNCRRQALGMAYVPGQTWCGTIDCEDGFFKGTVFAELYKPFHPKRGGKA